MHGATPGTKRPFFQTLPSASMLLELEKCFFLLVFQEILDETRGGLYRNGIICKSPKQTNTDLHLGL